jgi:hypothetical protein
LQVEESMATISADDYFNAPQGPCVSVNVVGSTRIALLAYRGRGGARFIAGGLLIDVTGPAVPPEVALDVATQVILQIP